MDNKLIALNAVDLAIDRIDQHFEGVFDEPIMHLPKEHILKVKEVLLKMKWCLENDMYPDNVNLKLGRIIVDSWPYDSEIGRLLLTAEESFSNFVKSRENPPAPDPKASANKKHRP